MSLNLQHCPLRYAWCCNTSENLKNKQTVYFIPEEKNILEGRGLSWRKVLLSQTASAELSTGIFHG